MDDNRSDRDSPEPPRESRKHLLEWLLPEIDIYYLAVTLVVSLLLIASLGPVRSPTSEIVFVGVVALATNVLLLALCFVGLAPWEFSRSAVGRCTIWSLGNFLCGTVLTFLILSLRALWALAFAGGG
ncbi:hypothetical protein FYK55_24185 [Roseiconus nitratireducens]|uniref:Uncharacterized protein n=1 Tax=Roseiconus nitratireducens TaxID=2605748 RepID=A0A5M6CW24_9BACT|nr:hypothetical protein [Roseiconus nitratireducens]KAA5539437.1 hypothetical protein FYK55_24185 [Roseiconus nitratireducens]